MNNLINAICNVNVDGMNNFTYDSPSIRELIPEAPHKYF